MNDTTTQPQGSPASDLFGIGDRVRFTGFRAASFDCPKIAIGAGGVIESVKRTGKVGWDYWIKLDDGSRVGLQYNEVELMRPNDPDQTRRG